MRAVTITAPGGPEVLRIAEVPDPAPAAGEVVIDIAAAGLNRADLLQRQGLYPPPPGAPQYPGIACSAGSGAKLDRCRELGAGLAINYRDEDFVAAVKDFTAGRGADVILDIIGAAYLERNLAALATSGRLTIIGLQGGTRAEIDLNALMRKRCSVHATTLRARTVEEK